MKLGIWLVVLALSIPAQAEVQYLGEDEHLRLEEKENDNNRRYRLKNEALADYFRVFLHFPVGMPLEIFLAPGQAYETDWLSPRIQVSYVDYQLWSSPEKIKSIGEDVAYGIRVDQGVSYLRVYNQGERRIRVLVNAPNSGDLLHALALHPSQQSAWLEVAEYELQIEYLYDY